MAKKSLDSDAVYRAVKLTMEADGLKSMSKRAVTEWLLSFLRSKFAEQAAISAR